MLDKKASNILFYFLLLLFLADIYHSYKQHYVAVIDGDLAAFVAPSEPYQEVFKDPFGVEIIRHKEYKAASNRFFFHWYTYTYFRHVPQYFQHFMSPIDSVYTASTVEKIASQIGLILMLASYICVTFNWGKTEFMLACVLICPFFQVTGYAEYLGIVDYCITYAIAYASTWLLLLIFFFPYYRFIISGKSGLPNWLKPLWLVFPIILCFSGPIINPVILIVCSGSLLILYARSWIQLKGVSIVNKIVLSFKSISLEVWISFGFAIAIGLYSLVIGKYNIENQWTPLSLSERYMKLFEGIVKILLSFKEGVLPLMIVVFFNFFILKLIEIKEYKKIQTLFIYMFLFSIVYLALLPLGGYRSYRPYIIRRDTLLPVLSILFFTWGLSSIYILKYLTKYKTYYIGFVLFILFTYTLADYKLPEYNNACERKAMLQIAASNEDCVELEEGCTVMQWGTTHQCEDTHLMAKVLHLWGITPRETLFKQKE